jgi:polyisoprenoid-binding protein YceI
MRHQSISIGLVLLLLAGCSVRPPPPPPVPAPGSIPMRLRPPADARSYDIVAADSLLTLRVYREGALASAGHNHVIASHGMRGRAWLANDIARSVVRLELDAAALTVDEPDLRAAAGPDFAAEVPDSARSGTGANLRGPDVLDVAQFPLIVLEARVATLQSPQQMRLAGRVFFKGREFELELPLQLQLRDGVLVASGELPLRQSMLGLTPFAVLLGALRVRDEMQVSYRVVARRSD